MQTVIDKARTSSLRVDLNACELVHVYTKDGHFQASALALTFGLFISALDATCESWKIFGQQLFGRRLRLRDCQSTRLATNACARVATESS